MTAGVLLCAKSLKAFHIASNEAYGFGSVAIEPRYEVGIKVGKCSFTAIRTISNTTSTPGARTRSLPEHAKLFFRTADDAFCEVTGRRHNCSIPLQVCLSSYSWSLVPLTFVEPQKT